MNERIWSFLGVFFTVTIIVGGLGLAYIADKYEMEPFFGSTAVKYSVIIYCLIGVFFIVYSEVRKRVEAGGIQRAGITLIAMLVIFAFLALTRL